MLLLKMIFIYSEYQIINLILNKFIIYILLI